MNFRKLFIAMLPLTLVLASAHPGHGLLEHGAGHVLSSMYHVLLLAVAALVMFAVAQFVQSSSAKKSLRFVGAAALLTAGALWGTGI